MVDETTEPMDHAEEAQRSLKAGWRSFGYALNTDSCSLNFAAAQAHATLALVEQQKRTADALEAIHHLLNNSQAMA